MPRSDADQARAASDRLDRKKALLRKARGPIDRGIYADCVSVLSKQQLADLGPPQIPGDRD